MNIKKGVGIDLGATAVRVVEVSGLDADSVAQITKCSIVPLQPGAIVAGQIKDPIAVAWALSRALKAANVSSYGAVLGVSSEKTAVSRITLPAALKPTEWLRTLRTADRAISPKIPLAQSAIAMYPVPDSDLATPHLRSLLAAASSEEEIAAILAVCKRAKVTPKAVDLSAAAMSRALTRSVLGNDDVAALVDIGSSKVTVATRQGLHLRSVRTFEGGGDRITRAVMGALGGSYDIAEERKLTMRLSAGAASTRPVMAAAVPSMYGALPSAASMVRPDGDASDSALSSTATNLIEDIAAAVEADAADFPDRPIQGLLLCGGTSLLRGFKEQLVQRVGVPAIIGRPWARIVPCAQTDYLLDDGVEDPVVLLSLATAIGLAIWKDPR